MVGTTEATGATGEVRTFLIADIRGYTQFTASRGDEASHRLAGKFAAVIAEGVESWGGRLVELRGDEALAVFASARSALRAAVELQEALADETRAEPELPLNVGMGLDAGEAVPMGDGFRGAALNLAARLCATALAGEIRVTESLLHLAGSVPDLRHEPLAPISLKGLDEPVTPYLVTAAGPETAERAVPAPASDDARVPPELDSLVPFAGRDAELRWLGWHWRRARRGHSRTIGIMGPTGIGKTRLAAELARRALREGGEVRYVAGADLSPDLWTEGSTPISAQLLVLDDLDQASVPALKAMAANAPPPGPGTLLLAAVRVPSDVAADITRLSPDGQRTLDRLDAAAVRAIAAFYAERAVDELPLSLIEEETKGIPAAIHRVASQLAQANAAQRIGSSAERAASGRRGLRTAEADVIRNVADLELATRRARLAAAPDDDADDGSAVMVCPYKGLAMFEADDADYYFGRERAVAELIARLVGSPFVAVVGASGSGKSSLLRAGLLPALAKGVLPGSTTWTSVVTRPGERPMLELGSALARTIGVDADAADPIALLDDHLARQGSAQRLLLIVDQFEEVFASADTADRETFLQLLTTPRSGLKVIVAVRADQYGKGAAYPALARQLAADHVLVGPLTAAEIAAIVEGPAREVGLRVEPELTEALVRDAGEEPGALPLLSTALLELWQARDGGRLTLAAYSARGGLRGAVARLAEAAYARLRPEQESIARSAMLRLAGNGEGETLVRRRVPIDEFDAANSPGMAAVLEVLTSQRLLTTGDGYVEVAHEALLREWPRFQGWLEEDATGRRLRLHLIAAAREWDARGREPGDLYRGARLAAMLDWSDEHEAELNSTERAFVAASRDAAEEEARRQRATNRRLRFLLGGAAIFLVAALVAGGIALVQSQQAQAEADRADAAADEADQERESAEEAALVNRSRELAASAVTALDTDATLARLLALSGAMLTEPPLESVSALRRALADDRVVATFSWPDDRVGNFAPGLHPSGRLIAMGGEGTTVVDVIDRETGAVLWSYDAGDGLWLSPPAFSPDGELLVVAIGSDGESEQIPAAERVGLFIFRADSGEVVRRLDGGTCGPELKALSAADAVIATAPEDAVQENGSCFHVDWTARELIDLVSGERTLLTLDGLDAALSVDGSTVAYDDLAADPFASIVARTTTGERLLTIDWSADDDGPGGVRALSPKGNLLVYGDRPIRIWDVAEGERIGFFHGHGGSTRSVAFAHDGASVYSAGNDSRLRQWEVRTGEEIRSFGPVTPDRVTLSSDLALVTREGGTAALFDLGARGEVGAVSTCHGFVLAKSLTVVEGQAVMAMNGCTDDPLVVDSVLVDMADKVVVTTVPEHQGQGIALSPDGTRFVRQDGVFPLNGGLNIRDARTGDVLTPLEGTCTYESTGEDGDISEGCHAIPDPPFPVWPSELIWSPDGQAIAAVNDTTDAAGGFVVWDATDGSVRFSDSIGVPHSATFTPDGAELLVATKDGDAAPVTIRRHSTDSGELIEAVAIDDLHGDHPDGFLGVQFVGFSGDGSTLFLVDSPATASARLVAMNLATLDIVGTQGGLTDGQLKSFAITPDRSLIAMGTSDGYVRIWDADAETFDLLQEIFVGDTQVQGLSFVSDDHLAVAPEDGSILIYTLDVDELLSIAGQGLSRGFTPEECEKYNFGDDCPTLEELTARD
ncbi:MAG TPA: AAA family ATPase [Candidatus Limnocylindria bacterium]|nr:AAA family ATPase [Candidatus Limnocylindria bacterium]